MIDKNSYREKLVAKRRQIEEHVRAQIQSAEKPSIDVQDAGDKAQTSYSKEFLYICTNADKEILDRIEEALARMDSGEFGACVHCGEMIGTTRLDAIPWARHCVRCQEMEERGLIP